jgi:hypothetical protein
VQMQRFSKTRNSFIEIRLQCIISDSLLQVALGIFYQVAEGPEEFLEDDSSILDSWRHTVKHICDMPSDVFFIL